MNAFVHEKRRSMTKARVARIYALREGRCGICKIQIGFKPYELDHIVPLSHGGTDLDDNIQILCRYCHAEKTGGDIRTAGKIKRTFSNHRVPTKYKRSRSWR